MTDNSNMLPVGATLRNGAYRIVRQLANGGFGNTYMIQVAKTGDTRAMKEFFIRGVNQRDGNNVTVGTTDNRATYQSQRDKFVKEAQRLNSLESPHIVRVHDLFDENGTSYYVMDFIQGYTLSEQVRGSGPLTEQQTWHVLHQMLDVLDTIHNASPRLFHLDIKPSNIMLDGRQHLYLIDFGSSKQIDTDQGLTMSSGLALTKEYAPLELEKGDKERIGPWTDLYELGGTLYFALTGQRPPSAVEMTESPDEAFRFPAGVSQQMTGLVTWMMQLNRKNRPQGVADVRAAMGGRTADEATKFQPHHPKETEQLDMQPIIVETGEGEKSSKTTRYLLIAASVLLLALAGMLTKSIVDDRPSQHFLDTSDITESKEQPDDETEGEAVEETEDEEDEAEETEETVTADSEWSGYHQLSGKFYNSSNAWPVEISLSIDSDGDVSHCTYRNVSQGVTINDMSGRYLDSRLSLYALDGSLAIELRRNGSGTFTGTATSGSVSLLASFYE